MKLLIICSSIISALWLALGYGSASQSCSKPEESIMFASSDYGTTWQNYTSTIPMHEVPMSFSGDEDGFYLGTLSGIFKGTVNKSNTVRWDREIFPQTGIQSIHNSQSGLFALSGRHGIFYKEKSKSFWQPFSQNNIYYTVSAVVEKTDHSFLLGTDSGLLFKKNANSEEEKIFAQQVDMVVVAGNNTFVITPTSLKKSKDEGKTWENLLIDNKTPRSIQKIGTQLWAVVSSPRLVGMHVDDMIFTSDDNGETWTNKFDKLPSLLQGMYNIQSIGKYLIACSKAGIIRSDDQGATWSIIHQDHSTKNYFYKVSVHSNVMYVLKSDGC